MKFMVTVWAAFLARVKPVSTMAKPACMNMTRNPATRVQTMLMELVLSATALATSSSFGGAASAMSIAAIAKVMALLEQGKLGGASATAGPASLHPRLTLERKSCVPRKRGNRAASQHLRRHRLHERRGLAAAPLAALRGHGFHL